MGKESGTQGAVKPMLSVSTLLACSDARFVKHFVNVHSEGPAMWDRLKNLFVQAKMALTH